MFITMERKISRKFIIIILLVVIILASLGVIQLIHITTDFWVNLPKILNIEGANAPLVSYKPDLKAREKEQKINDIVYDIYGLESTWGRNDHCRQQGKYNGYGYGVNSRSALCFDNHEQATQAVTNWVTARYDWELSTMLCYYNQGRMMKDCNYYQNYLRLN